MDKEVQDTKNNRRIIEPNDNNENNIGYHSSKSLPDENIKDNNNNNVINTNEV